MDPIKIHPFDLYIIMRDNPEFPVIEHEPIKLEDGYAHALLEVGGTLYAQTTSVPAKTTEII